MYCLIRRTFKYNSFVQKICLFLQKETSHCKISLTLDPQGPKQYIFGDHFYSKNAKKLRFHVFLLFHARKHMTSSFYLKWTKFARNLWIWSNCGSPGTPVKLEQIRNFLWAFRNFLNKNGCQKYSAWIPRVHFIHMRVKDYFVTPWVILAKSKNPQSEVISSAKNSKI